MDGEGRPLPRSTGDDRWATVGATRRVLAVARNLASAGRLADVLTVFASDSRVQTLFTMVKGSAFDDGLHEFLSETRARIVPWRQAVRSGFDLALAASANGDLHELRAPLLLMPHGAGHNRLLRTLVGFDTQVAGLARSQLVRGGRVLPAAIALSHREQVDRLTRCCPEAVQHAMVTGDPCFDRIVAHLPRRERYRRAFGVPESGKLVVVSSTWGKHSLFGTDSGLPARLTAELPMDEYRVVLVTHPNIRAWHGGLQVDLWLARARAAGLVVVPPERGWQAALVAADIVVGDHGSVTFYGVALDRPALLASSGRELEELDADSPTAELSRTLPRLDRGRGLLPQVRHALATHVPGAYAHVTERTLGNVGGSGEALRSVAYRLMRLPVPPGPVVPAVLPDPVAERIEPTAFQAQVRFGPGDVIVQRFPVAATLTNSGVETHLVVDAEELDRRLLESAAVILGRDQPPGWRQEALRRYPGCAAAALTTAPGQVLMSLSSGAEVLVSSDRQVDAAVLASVVYAWMEQGRALDALPVADLTLRVGSSRHVMHVIKVTPPPALFSR